MQIETDVPDVDFRIMTENDVAAVSHLHATTFGPGRFTRTAYRIRERTSAISPFCHVAVRNKDVLAAVSFTPITIGSKPNALLLGPLAVATVFANRGLGRSLIARTLSIAREHDYQLVILVGDLDYYARLDFAVTPLEQIALPGPVDPARILACELVDGALAGYHGKVSAAA